MKKQLSFVLASLMLLNPAVKADSDLDKDAVTPPICAEKNVGIKEKVSNKFKELKDTVSSKVKSLDAKTVAKEVALAPLKACRWVLKYELIAIGVLIADACVAVGVSRRIILSRCHRRELASAKLDKYIENPPVGYTAEDVQKLKDFLAAPPELLNAMRQSLNIASVDNLFINLFQFPTNTILKHIENDNIIEALKIYYDFCSKIQSPKGRTATVHPAVLVEFEETIDNILKQADMQAKLKMVDNLNDIFKLFVVRCDGTQDSVDDNTEFIFDGDINFEHFQSVYEKLKNLNVSVGQNTLVHRLCAQFNSVYKAAKAKVDQIPLTNNISNVD